MRYSLKLFFITIIQIFTLVIRCLGFDAPMKRFVVVSSLSEAQKFYPYIRSTHTDLENVPELNTAMRKRICEDITSNHIFRRGGKLPYEKYVDVFSRLIDRFMYPIKTKEIMPYNCLLTYKEEIFVCLVRDGWSNVEYYISKEYNLNSVYVGVPLPYMAGRFIFHRYPNLMTRLYALSELPAEAFFSPDHNVEEIYLHRREIIFNTPAWTAREDALCSLGASDQERICVAAIESEYFARRIKFSSGDKFEGSECKLRTVTFQTEQAKLKAVKHKQLFNEWMLSCKLEKSNVSFDYLLSHAYLINQIFVYFWPKNSEEVFLEALLTNVRLDFDLGRTRILHTMHIDIKNKKGVQTSSSRANNGGRHRHHSSSPNKMQHSPISTHRRRGASTPNHHHGRGRSTTRKNSFSKSTPGRPSLQRVDSSLSRSLP